MPNALFVASDFFPLGAGVETLPNGNGTLGDIDGDGDADLVAAWTRPTVAGGPEPWGWTVAFNDGLGGFVSTQEVIIGPTNSLPRVEGDDFDGDGLLDLVFQASGPLELWHNRGKAGFAIILQLSDASLCGLADGDGDGDVDLLVLEHDDRSSHVVLWLNDGAAGFARGDRFVLDSEEKLFPRLLAGQPLGESVRLLWIRPCYLPQGAWQVTRLWTPREEPPLFFDAVVNPCDVHLLTDLDGDGGVELIGSSERNLQFDPTNTNGTRHGWPGRCGPTRRRWGLFVSVAGGRADALPQDGQTRIDARGWSGCAGDLAAVCGGPASDELGVYGARGALVGHAPGAAAFPPACVRAATTQGLLLTGKNRDPAKPKPLMKSRIKSYKSYGKSYVLLQRPLRQRSVVIHFKYHVFQSFRCILKDFLCLA